MKDTKDIIESSYFKKVLELIKSVLPVIIYPNEPESLAVKITKLHLESQIKEKPIRTAEEIDPTKDTTEILNEREALFQAFDKIRASFKGRHWLMEGRGCYPYDDERYKEEVRYIMDEFEEINTNLWKQIKSKSFEYRKSIEEPLQKRIAELEASQLKENAIRITDEDIEQQFPVKRQNNLMTIVNGHRQEGAKWASQLKQAQTKEEPKELREELKEILDYIDSFHGSGHEYWWINSKIRDKVYIKLDKLNATAP